MFKENFLKVEIGRRSGWEWDQEMLEKYWIGFMGIFPAIDGIYQDINNNPIKIEMNVEQADSGLWIIAVTSQLFVGHERMVGGRGDERRIVDMHRGKQTGATRLDSFRKLLLKVGAKEILS